MERISNNFWDVNSFNHYYEIFDKQAEEKNGGQQSIKTIEQVVAKPNGWGIFARSPNFQIWLIEKKDIKENLKIQLVFNPMVVAHFQPYCSYTQPLPTIMKKTFVILLILIGFTTFGQENRLDQIKSQVGSIESDPNLTVSEFDLAELTGMTTDGGGFIKVWRNKKQICKIVEEIGLSYGRLKNTIYLKDGVPIKIIETEENFGHKNNELNYNELNEVFKAIIIVFDWENDESHIEEIGKRVMSEGTCSTFEYEPIIERAEIAIMK